MEFDEFVRRVQNRAQMASTGEAVRAIHATLQTLGECLHRQETDGPAAQLPKEIGAYLTLGDANGDQILSLNESYHRTDEQESVDYPVAVYHITRGW